jgi:predicted nucleotidyltransferase component of viral defense system
VQPIAVEKDYWVCEVLRAIVGAHGADVVFKGGTSLEKASSSASRRISISSSWASTARNMPQKAP